MNGADTALHSVFQRLTSPQILAEVFAIVVAGLIALAGAHFVTLWHRNHVSSSRMLRQPLWQQRVLEGCVIVAPYLVALIVLVLVRGALALGGTHTSVVSIACS